MKLKNYIMICAAFALVSLGFAQTPEKLNYQAVVRASDNSLVTNQAVGMQVTVLQNSANGTPVYVETHTTTSSAEGLVSVSIGLGAVQNGDFSTIDWSAGPYFVKVETDPEGGSNYTLTATSELMSVPYALHAKTAETVTNVTLSDVSDGAVSVESGVMVLKNLTTAERDALTNVVGGMVIYNTDEKQVQVASAVLEEGGDQIGGGSVNDTDVSLYGQTFVAGGNSDILEIDLNAENAGSVTLNIYEGTGNTGALLYSDNQSVSIGVNTFVLNSTVSVTAGNTYTIQFEGCECRFSASDPYGSGQIIEMADPGASGYDVFDFYFIVRYSSGFASWIGL